MPLMSGISVVGTCSAGVAAILSGLLGGVVQELRVRLCRVVDRYLTWRTQVGRYLPGGRYPQERSHFNARDRIFVT